MDGVTDRRRETTLLETGALQDAIFNSANFSSIATDARGVIQIFNVGAERMLGYAAAEVVNRITPADISDPPELIARAAALSLERGTLITPGFEALVFKASRGIEDIYELTYIRKDGSRFPALVSVTALRDAHDGIIGYLLIGTDNTARKEVEARQAQLDQRLQEKNVELEHANRMKSEFLTTVSHELRTPLNAIIGLSEVLRDGLIGPMSEPQSESIADIFTSAQHLLSLINDILDLSKVEAGRMELERSPVALPELIESVCDTLAPLALDKGVDLDLFIAPQVPAQIWSDPTRLRQVLFNLAGNAIKFSAGLAQRRGRVSIRAEVADGAPAQLILRVADNGVGMTPETLLRVFSSFTQAEASTTRRFGGTGLGLTICKRLVGLMQGEIDARSTPDAGSCFTVTLPMEVVQGGTGAPVPDLGGLDCLLVDGADTMDDLRVYLEHAGARVHRVGSMAAAVQCARGLRGPVVIQSIGHDTTPLDLLHAPLAATPDVHHLVIARGQRKPARVVTANMVKLAGSCLGRAALLAGVAVAAGRMPPEALRDGVEGGMHRVRAEPLTIAQAREQGRLILVAEDDEINQKVILRQIGILGYAAEIADSGAEALRLWRAGHHALLLTDLHMPGLDGYSLAEAIRAEEAARQLPHDERMPILALTANALRGEAQRARAVGMDEYLTKPLRLQLLKDVLETWLPPAKPDAVSGARGDGPAAGATPPAIDLAVLNGMVGHDPQVVREFIADFRTSARRLAGELRTARAADDMRQIAAIAHKLKSSSRSVGAVMLGDACTELENDCRTGAREGLARDMVRFEAAWLAVDALTP